MDPYSPFAVNRPPADGHHVHIMGGAVWLVAYVLPHGPKRGAIRPALVIDVNADGGPVLDVHLRPDDYPSHVPVPNLRFSSGRSVSLYVPDAGYSPGVAPGEWYFPQGAPGANGGGFVP